MAIAALPASYAAEERHPWVMALVRELNAAEGDPRVAEALRIEEGDGAFGEALRRARGDRDEALVAHLGVRFAAAGLVPDSNLHGEIESCELPRAGELILRGWALRAIGAEDRAPVRVEVDLDGARVGESEQASDRPELADRFRRLGLLPEGVTWRDRHPRFHCGWECRCRIPEILDRARSILVVRLAADCDRRLISLGSLEHSLARITELDAERYRQRAEEVAEIIEKMKESFFWRLRTRWFAMKRALGLTEER